MWRRGVCKNSDGSPSFLQVVSDEYTVHGVDADSFRFGVQFERECPGIVLRDYAEESAEDALVYACESSRPPLPCHTISGSDQALDFEPKDGIKATFSFVARAQWLMSGHSISQNTTREVPLHFQFRV